MLIVYALSLIGALIHLLFVKPKKNAAYEIVEIILLYQLIFTVGIGGLLGFYAHAFMSDQTAEYIGWPKGNPFQLEVAYTNLTFGILGILSVFFRGNFWLATLLGVSIWFLLDAYYHIRDLAVYHNDAPGNAGLPLYSDIAIPTFLLGLWTAKVFLSKKKLSF